jgi:formylglycine-generating enzyme required for sulfatase activity
VSRARILVGIAAASLAPLGCMVIGGLADYHLAPAAEDEGGAHDVDARSDAPAADATPSDGSTADAAFANCRGLAAKCGPAATSDCCSRSMVPGGSFLRGYDGVPDGGFDDPSFPATIGDYWLDTYEITVGRFRAFVDGYPSSLPPDGAGKNPRNPDDVGWRSTWIASPGMPADRDALSAALACTKATWTDAPGSAETLPINCLTWLEAYAFCIWDGGRLPTEAEWNFAAAGGDEQRRYPWGAATVDSSYAVFGVPDPAVVGTRSPKGDGRWGQADLVGNLWEFLFDRTGAYILSCDNCGPTDLSSPRMSRGGCFGCLTKDMNSSSRGGGPMTDRRGDVGSRCARDRP